MGRRGVIVGVTGPFASGKSLASSWFRSRGFRVIDVDRVGHAVLEQPGVKKRLDKAFGPRIFRSDGRIDRPLLGSLVFDDPVRLCRLNAIVHPVMKKEVRRLAAVSARPAVIDAALLFEMGLDRLCDTVLLVTAPRSRIILRAAARNGFSPSRTKAVLEGQWPVPDKRRKADLTVSNSSTPAAFRRALVLLAKKGRIPA